MKNADTTPLEDPIGLEEAEEMLPPDDAPEQKAGPAQARQQDTAAERQAEDLFAPAGLSPAEQGALLTALLFAAAEVISAERLAEYFEMDPAELDVLAAEAAGSLRPLGLDIVQVAGGLKLVTSSQWDSFLKGFHRQVRKGRLSKSSLEILAVIAYEQPVTRSRVDELRQVNSESTVRSLLDKRLITVKGRADAPGRPFLYGTTKRFLEVFGLHSLDDLPPRPPSFESAKGIDLGARDDDTPGLDDLPGFDEDILEQDELED